MLTRRVIGFVFAASIALALWAGPWAGADPVATIRPNSEIGAGLTDEELRATAPRATASPAAATACGDVNSNGTVTSADIVTLVNYVFKGGAAPSCPGCILAWGAVRATGTIENAGSGDWSSNWSAASMRYQITITGETYFYSSYHTSVTASGGDVRTVSTSSIGGILLVYIFDAAGNPVQDNFTFTVTKF